MTPVILTVLTELTRGSHAIKTQVVMVKNRFHDYLAITNAANFDRRKNIKPRLTFYRFRDVVSQASP